MSAWTFLREFTRDPVKVGAVAPSGRALAALEIDAADIHPDHVVVELGAGTGPMTAELVSRFPDLKLLVIEPNDDLATVLERRHPTVKVARRFAQDLPELVAAMGEDRVDRVVSSLPWAAWPAALQAEVFAAIESVLAPDARLVTFTYAHAMPLPAARRFRAQLESRFRSVSRTRIAWTNLPPAFVYVCDGPIAHV
ncbi:MAG: phosphatidylethanolamine/phosphatidyl-N-methylethanolamine N-methyltransferase [Myxococcota bacterium]